MGASLVTYTWKQIVLESWRRYIWMDQKMPEMETERNGFQTAKRFLYGPSGRGGQIGEVYECDWVHAQPPSGKLRSERENVLEDKTVRGP